jgi:hypothetical protein
MREYMLLVLNKPGEKDTMSPAQHSTFVRECEDYIEQLKSEGRLISAQPLIREGLVVSGGGEQWEEAPLGNERELQVGYYHIRASDLKEAVAIAKRNPEFRYTRSARIEVRPVKTTEERTGFVYPR